VVSGAPSVLRIPASEGDLLRRAARAAAPREACGLLLGERDGRVLCVRAARELRNLCETTTGFVLDPVGLRDALVEADAAGLALLGAWHSHPSGHLQLSAQDRAGTPEGWCQVVLGGASLDQAEAWWKGPSGVVRLALEGAKEGGPGSSRRGDSAEEG
jgi:proteasome lid subunit RPN8/RPN11